MKARRIRSVFLIAASVLAVDTIGCIEFAPPSESILAGTWELVPDDPLDSQVAHWYLTFDSNGALAKIKYTFVDLTSVTLDYPPASVNVDGDQVHISATKSGNGLSFNGTLDSATAPETAAGSLTSNFTFGELDLSVLHDEATLVKQ